MKSPLFVFAMLVASCCPDYSPKASTGTQCADPDPVTGTSTLTWQNFGHDFMCHYCTNCHDSGLPRSMRNGAPLFHDLDYMQGVLEVVDHVDQQAGSGPMAHNDQMPGGGSCGRCPSTPGGSLDHTCLVPTDEERQQLSQWLACQRLRTAENQDPMYDEDHSDHCASYTGPR